MATRPSQGVPYDINTTSGSSQEEDLEKGGSTNNMGDQASRHIECGITEKGKDGHRFLPSELDSVPEMVLECEDHGPLTIPKRPRFLPRPDNKETGSTTTVAKSQLKPSWLLGKDHSKRKKNLDLGDELSNKDVCKKSRKKEEAAVTSPTRRNLRRTTKTLLQDTPTSTQRITRSSTLNSLAKQKILRNAETKTNLVTPLRRQTRPSSKSTQEHVTKSPPNKRIGKKMSQPKSGKLYKAKKPSVEVMEEKSVREKGPKGAEIATDDVQDGSLVSKKTKRQSGQQRREVTKKAARQKSESLPVRGKVAKTRKAVQSGTNKRKCTYGEVLKIKKRTKKEPEGSFSKKNLGLRRSARMKEAPSNFNSSLYFDSDGDDRNDLENKQGGHRKKRMKETKDVSSDDVSIESGSDSDWDTSITVKKPAGTRCNKNVVKKEKKQGKRRKGADGRYTCDHCSFAANSELRITAHISRDHGVAVQNWAPRRPRGNRKQHKCEHCNYTSEKSPVLYNHTLTIHKGGAVCVSCSFTGNSLVEMLQHEDEKHPRCKIARCQFKTDDPKKLAEHLKIHMPDGMFKCPECENRFRTRRQYIRHAAKAHGIKPAHDYNKTNKSIGEINLKVFKCDMCDYRAIGKHLKRHILCKHTKKEELKYACTLCDHRAPYKSWLELHVQQKHEGKKQDLSKYKFTIYKCDMCDYETRTKVALQTHRLRKHGLGEGPVKCERCDFTTTLKTHLATHLKRDHNIEIRRCLFCRMFWGTEDELKAHHDTCKYKGDFPCQYCTFVAPSKLRFKRHMRNEHGTGKWPQLCHLCGKVFCGEQKLEEHLLIHEQGNPYKCPYESCKYATIYKANMPAHLRIHTGEKPFKCDLCSYSSVQKSNLVTHMKRHYRGGKQPQTGERGTRGVSRKMGVKKKRQTGLKKDAEDEAKTATSHLIAFRVVDQTTDTASTGLEGTEMMERDTGGSTSAKVEREDKVETAEDQGEEYKEEMNTSMTVQNGGLAII